MRRYPFRGHFWSFCLFLGTFTKEWISRNSDLSNPEPDPNSDLTIIFSWFMQVDHFLTSIPPLSTVFFDLILNPFELGFSTKTSFILGPFLGHFLGIFSFGPFGLFLNDFLGHLNSLFLVLGPSFLVSFWSLFGSLWHLWTFLVDSDQILTLVCNLKNRVLQMGLQFVYQNSVNLNTFGYFGYSCFWPPFPPEIPACFGHFRWIRFYHLFDTNLYVIGTPFLYTHFLGENTPKL